MGVNNIHYIHYIHYIQYIHYIHNIHYIQYIHYILYIHYIHYINRLASLYGRPNTSEKQPYITPKSNPSKEKKHLPGLYTYKTQLTADFGQIWVSEMWVPGQLDTSNFVCSMIGAQLEYPQNFRFIAVPQAEI